MTFKDWCATYKESIVFRPQAPFTGDRFGMRVQESVGSPAHLGEDRGEDPRQILAPFDKTYMHWQFLGEDTDWGSCLRIHEVNSPMPIEFHVAHTLSAIRESNSFADTFDKGTVLPAVPGSLGLAQGVHTHTEGILEYTPTRIRYFREIPMQWIYMFGEMNTEYLLSFARMHNIAYNYLIPRLKEQIIRWGITELKEYYAVRHRLPLYRTPFWGPGTVILFSTKYFLNM